MERRPDDRGSDDPTTPDGAHACRVRPFALETTLDRRPDTTGDDPTAAATETSLAEARLTEAYAP